jgi:ABC-type glycerol-3-phosphate transport system permease component
LHAILLVFAGLAIAPLLLILLAALKSNAEISVDPLGLPRHWLFTNFGQAWETARLGRFLVNSILVTGPTLILVLATSSLAGYAFGMVDFPGSRSLFALFLLGLMVPTISVAVPIYYTVRDLKLLDTLPGLMLVETAQALPIAIFVMRASFRSLPRELRDAARVDGCGEFGVFMQVMMPISRAALTAVTVLAFLSVWNSFLMPLLLINDEDLRTLPLGMSYLQGKYQANIVLIAASAVITVIPTITVYLVLQRQFLRGVIDGSLK